MKNLKLSKEGGYLDEQSSRGEENEEEEDED